MVQWRRFVAAWNERDWATFQALLSDDFTHGTVTGAVLSSTPTSNDKASLLALVKTGAEKYGLMHHTQSVVGLHDTVVTTYEERFENGQSWRGYGIVRFNGEGQIVEAYTAVPGGVRSPT